MEQLPTDYVTTAQLDDRLKHFLTFEVFERKITEVKQLLKRDFERDLKEKLLMVPVNTDEEHVPAFDKGDGEPEQEDDHEEDEKAPKKE